MSFTAFLLAAMLLGIGSRRPCFCSATLTGLVLAPAILGQGNASPLISSDVFSTDAQWTAIEASPRVVVHVSDGGKGSCVLVGVKENHLYALTASHVIKPNARITIDLFDRATYPASDRVLHDVAVVGTASAPDLALLKIPVPAEQKMPPTLRLIPPGQRPKRFPADALSVGSNDGFSARCQADPILAKVFVRRNGEDAFFWRAAQPSVTGRSGGPLLDPELRVLGICVANRDGYGYFTHADEIHAWLKQLGYEWLWQ